MTHSIKISMVLLLSCAAHADARIVVQQKGRAQLQFSDQFTVALSDVVRVDLVVDGSDDMIVEMPKEMPAGSKWQLVERRPEHKQKIGVNRARWSVYCGFAPQEPGKKVEFLFPPIKVRDGKQEESITFAPVYFVVTTQIKEADVKQLRGSPEIEPLPPLEPRDNSQFVILAGLIGVLVLVAFVIAAWRWRRRSNPRSLALVALADLDRLIAMQLPEKGRSERFVTLLTTLVRRYLDRQFGLRARRQTTAEFLQALQHCEALEPEDKQLLTEFLQSCEAVKFARDDMSVADAQKWAERIRQFIEKRSIQGLASPTPV